MQAKVSKIFPKVKHPIFLSAKFSSCVRLFYNTNLLKFPPETVNDKFGSIAKISQQEKREEEIILIMQKVLMENGTKEKGEGSGSNKAFDNKYFILLIEEPNNVDSFQLNKKVRISLDGIF